MESCAPLTRLIRVRVLLHNPKRTPRRTRSSGSGSSVASLPRIPFPPAPSRSPSPCFLRSAAAPAVSRPYLRSSRGARRSTTPSSTLRSPATARRGSACWAIREGSPFLMAGRFSLARPVLFVVVYLPSCLFDRAIATVICSAFCSRSPRPSALRAACAIMRDQLSLYAPPAPAITRVVTFQLQGHLNLNLTNPGNFKNRFVS